MNKTLENSIETFLQQYQSAGVHPGVISVSTDSRNITPNALFIPIRGMNFDGHQFIFDTLTAGASLALSELSLEELKQLPGYKPELISKVIIVPSTLAAYHQIANRYRSTLNPLCIGITGSSGKTTCKEIMKLVLSQKYKVHSTEANYNNEIGLPKTILSMPEDTEILILEMAMRGLEQISLLSQTASPNIALITNIGTAHIELLGSKDNIRKAKMEILGGLKDYQGWRKLESLLLLDQELYDFCKANNFIDPNTKEAIKAKKILSFDSTHKFKLNGLISDGLMADANAIALIAKELGMSDLETQQALLLYNPGKGRGEFSKDNQGNIVIDETYNANPEAIRNSVEALIKQFPAANKIVVIGKILESQEDLIHELFAELEDLKNQTANYKFIDARDKEIETIVSEIKSSCITGEENVILLKASRGAKLERVFEYIN